MDDHDASKPYWVAKNERFKERLGLPEYRPPRFRDGVATYEVTDDLQTTYGCTIRFVGDDTSYLDDWEVRVDGEPVFGVGRHRDENGNTVYEMASATFRERLADELEAGSAGSEAAN